MYTAIVVLENRHHQEKVEVFQVAYENFCLVADRVRELFPGWRILEG